MIENFEELTYELTPYEKNVIVPYMVDRLKHNIGNRSAVTNRTIIKRMEEDKNFNLKLTSTRIRKLINYIRVNDLIPCLMATSKGYYRANSIGEIESYIRSLKQRERAIRQMREAIERQFKLSTSGELF